MVEIQIQDGTMSVDVRGLHKLWALKGRLQVPVVAVKGARRLDPGTARRLWKGLRIPGTHVPGVIAAGTFYKHGERHFWDVADASRALEIELGGTRYARLFVEVEDPEATLATLLGATQRAE